MIRNITRQQYQKDYRRARILFKRYGAIGTDPSIGHEANSSLYALRGVNRPTDRILEFSEMWVDPRLRPMLFTGVFRVRKSDYPAVSRFPTVIIVRREPETLSATGEIYRAFERLDGGQLFPLYISGETFDALRQRVNIYLSHKRPVLVHLADA